MKKTSTIFYFEARTKYDKFYLRLQKNITSGAFWKFTVAKRNMLVKRLAQLKKRLEVLNPQWSVALATGAVALVLNANTAVAQPFVQQTGTNNPVSVVSGYSYDFSSSLVDIDNDGDLDLFVANYNQFDFYKNTGTKTKPIFTQQTGTSNPLDGNNPGNFITLTFGDIDGDGDYDLVGGGVISSPSYSTNSLFYYKNTGTKSTPAFTLQTATNIFPAVASTFVLTPQFADIDGDGDLDILAGDVVNASIYFIQNTGSATAPNFVYNTTSANPFSSVNGFIGTSAVSPAFADIDGDGDLDAIVGVYGSTNQYYKNTGTKTAAVFSLVSGTASPFNSFSTSAYYFMPSFGDIDSDGDMDLLVGNTSKIDFYQNQAPIPPVVVVPPVTTSTIGSSIVNNISSEVSLYPNPAKDAINFTIANETLGTVEAILLNASGAEVKKEYFTTDGSSPMTMDISELHNGIYMLNLKSENKVAVVKVVKQ